MKTPLLVILFLFAYLLPSEPLAAQEDYKKYIQFSYAELDSLAYLAYRNGAFDKAIPYMKAGREKAKLEFGENDSLFAQYTGDLGFFYDQMGQYTEAEPLYLQAMNIKAKVFGKEHPSFAKSLNNLASLYKMMESYDLAEPLYLQAKNIREKVLGKEHPDFATSLNDLASFYQSIGNYEKAAPLFLQAKNIRAKALGEKHPLFASSLNNLAALYNYMGDYENAKEFYLQALNIREKVLGNQHPDFATSLNNLAVLYRDMGNYDKALPLFLKATNIWQKALGERHPNFAAGLNNLAVLYKNKGNADSAIHYCTLGIIALSEELQPGFKDWGNLDKFKYSSNRQINKAIATLLSILEEQYKKTGDKTILELHYLTVQATMRLNERIRNDFMGESDKLRSLETNSTFVLQGIRSAINLAQENYEQAAFGFAEMNKGVLLMDAARAEKAYQFGDLPDSLGLWEKDLQKKHAFLEAKLLEKRPRAERDSLLIILNRTKQEITNFTKSLKKDYPKYVALKYENKTANAKEIQALLDDKTALLEYLIGDSVIYIFYIDKNQVKLTAVNLSNKVLNEKIKLLHSTLSDYASATKKTDASSYQKYTENAYWFYEKLVHPTLQYANGIQSLIIIPDGELAHLPFETFLTKPAPKGETNYKELSYLLNEYKISYNYAAAVYKSNKEATTHKNNGQLLAMTSNYELNIDSSKMDWRLPSERNLRAALPALPAAVQEAETLEKSFKGFFAFNKDASEKNFKEKAAQYAVIHLAMHGLLDSKNPILSSLAFSEDGDSTENNFLQAYEISKMQLNAELVVLSACETGYGKFEKGNGTASLARAFMYAGVPAMVVSLWQVNDASTAYIMQLFYKNLAKGLDKAEALRQAKIDYIGTVSTTTAVSNPIAAHPAFWAPFILIGDERPIAIATKGSGMMWYLIGGVGLLAVVGAVFALRRHK